MDKEYMLSQVYDRIDELEVKYNDTFSPDIAWRTQATVKRSRIKRDLCILLYIKELLLACPDDLFIQDENALEGLDKILKGTCSRGSR